MNRMELEGKLLEFLSTESPDSVIWISFSIWVGVNYDHIPPCSKDQVVKFVQESIAAAEIRLMCFRDLEKCSAFNKNYSTLEILNGEPFRSVGLANFFDEDLYSWVINDRLLPMLDLFRDGLDLQLGRSTDDASLFEYAINDKILHQIFQDFDTDTTNNAVIVGNDEFLRIQDPAGLNKLIQIAPQIIAQNENTPQDIEKSLLGRTGIFHNASSSLMITKLWFIDRLIGTSQLGYEWHFAPVYNHISFSIENSKIDGIKDDLVSCIQNSSLLPFYLDWMLYRMEQYINGARLRLKNGYDSRIVESICSAYYDYLISRKPRTPVPTPVDIDSADALVEALRILIVQVSPPLGLVLLQGLKPGLLSVAASKEQWDICI